MLREAILVCYRSGQMSAAQFERHCEDDPELRTLVSGDSPSDLPPSLAVKPNLDCSEQTIDQLEAERVYWDERVRTASGFASANAAVEFRDACDTWINRKRSKGGDANASALSRADDASPGVKTGATGPIAAIREALEECANDLAAEIENRYRDGIKDHPAMTRKYRRDMETVARARGALAYYNATVASARQSTDVETMARKIADIWGPYGERRENLYSDLLSFAARVAADQREELAAAREALEHAEIFFRRILVAYDNPIPVDAKSSLWSDRADYMAKCAKAGEERTRAALGKRGEG